MLALAHMTHGRLRFTTLVTAMAASGCLGTSPAVMRSMTSLPDDQDKQHEQMASSLARPGDADSRKPLPGKLKGVETAAASVAAVIGMFYSTSPNVLLGSETKFEENLLFDPNLRKRPHGGSEEEGDDGEKPDDSELPADGAAPLVPWIRLAPPPQ
jgi:hypothetical protein